MSPAVDFSNRIVDRREPKEFTHVEQYPGRQLRMLQRTVEAVEDTLTFPDRYVAIYDQGSEGACVGYGESILCSINNRKLYDAMWLYREAQLIDEWSSTPPEEGTSLSAGFDILRTKGHRRLWGGQSRPPEMDEGIVEVNRWLTTVDEIRTALAAGKVVCLGINWYYQFYNPLRLKTGPKGKIEAWVGPEKDDASWGGIAGGHCICLVGASDRRQAGLLANSWGKLWGVNGKAWISYEKLRRLLAEGGEAAIVTDR
jgi:hypothetical protein